jgi:transposase
MIPSEYSSGSRQRLGALSKQGNPFLRFLCEAAITAVRRDPTLRRFYRRKLQQKGLAKAKVAAARMRSSNRRSPSCATAGRKRG